MFASEISEFSPNQISAQKMVHFKNFAKSGEEKKFQFACRESDSGKTPNVC